MGEDVHETLDKRSMTEVAYQTIRNRILDNEWSPGFQATEQLIAQELEMSRTPVHEALTRLHQERLVDLIPRHGMRVLPVSINDMKEIYEVLTSLESTAAELAAKRRLNDRQRTALERATDDMEAALKKNDLDGWAYADERFHSQLLELSGNKMLKSLVMNVWDRSHRARMIALRLRAKPFRSTDEHRAVAKAIIRGDQGAARDLHRAHRERAGAELLEVLRKHRLTNV